MLLSTRMNRSVIGLVGQAGVGKGRVAHVLTENGFNAYSLSDSLRKTATDIGLSHEREVLITLGNSLRERFGGDILARGAKQWIDSEDATRVVIDSIRNPSEVSFLQREAGAFVIGVTMSPEKRFRLMRDRNRPGDPQTWDEFQQLLYREQGVGEKASGQQVQRCLELADELLPNEGTIIDLHNHTKELLHARGMLEGYTPQRERR